MKKLDGKPCRRCGVMLQGIKRTDRNAYTYPKVCEDCRPLVGARGENHPRWSGGRTVGPTGYIYLYDPATQKRVLEHIVVWETAYGPRPPGRHHIHHINGIRSDNRIENLALMTADAHIKHHHQPLARWAKKYDQCVQCGTDESPHCGLGFCRKCTQRKRWIQAKAQGKPWAAPAPRVSAWARHYERCKTCGTTDIPHNGRGLCRRCQSKEWEPRRAPRAKH